MVMKRCNKCKKEFPLDNFPVTTKKTGYRRSVCEGCYKAQCAEYRANNKEKVRANERTPKSRFSNQRCQAKKRSLNWDLTLEEFSELITQPCQYCGGELNETGSGLDRLDIHKGYSTDNVVPCCAVCNVTRSSIFTSEEMQILGTVISKINEDRKNKKQPKLGTYTLFEGNRGYWKRNLKCG